MDSSLPFVVLVVLNWNGYADTVDCLQSLSAIDYPNHQTIVVDNGSADDSPEKISAEFPHIPLIRCAQNKGIAAGYNQGFRSALELGADYVVVMNNDLVFAPDFLTQMVNTTQQWPQSGVIMPKIYYYSDPQIIWATGGQTRWMPSNILLRGRQQKDGPKWSTTEPILFAPSCCLLIKREVCEQIKFDEAYFFYYDDWDYCVQVRKAGWQIIYDAQAKMWHKVSRSTQNSPKSLRWWKILGQSCVRYHRKHHNYLLLFLYTSWVILREIAKGNLKVLPTFVKGIAEGVAQPLNSTKEITWQS